MDAPGTINTGLLAAAADPAALKEGGTVSVPAEPQVTAAVTAPLNPVDAPNSPEQEIDHEAVKNATRALVQLPKDLDEKKLVELAVELAKDIRDETTVLNDFGLNIAHLEFLKVHNEFFKHTLAAAVQEWRSVKSTPERIKLSAAAILEESLLHVGERMLRPGENLNGVVEAGKFLAKVAGLDVPDKAQAAPGGRFNIQINLGAGQEVAHSSPARSGTPASITIQQDGEG